MLGVVAFAGEAMLMLKYDSCTEVGYRYDMLFSVILACSSGGVVLSGTAEQPGNPVRFVQLCQQQDPTALAIKQATQQDDCEQAGNVLSKVDTIDFNKSSLEKIDLQSLERLTNLISISAYGKKIDTIAPLAGLVRLKDVYLMQNEIVDISPLATLNQIRYLRLDGNNIVDISVLSKLNKLEKLGLDANQIEDFRPIAKIPNLQDLNTNFNPVDLALCPDGDEVTKDLRKYCKRMKKNAPDMQGAMDPK